MIREAKPRSMGSQSPRILHVVSSIDPRAGGPAVAVAGLAAAQKRCGTEVSIIATAVADESSDAAKELGRQGIPVQVIGPCSLPMRRHPQILPTLQRLIPQMDIVHIHALWEEVQHQSAILCRRKRKPYILRPCGMLDPWSLQQRWLKKWLYLKLRLNRNLNGAVAIHYTSELERDLAAPLGLRPPALVVPNGVDLREFETLPQSGLLRQRFPDIGDRQIVLFLSRLHPKKGVDLLLRAFAKAGSDARVLVIAGPDSDGYENEMREQARALGLEQSVVFTGPLYGADKLAALHDADLFVLPSHQENFGIAVVEALAAGLPVVISDQVNIYREIKEAGVGGVVRLDVDELASELNRWLSDRSLRTGAAARARSFAREHYDWNRIAQRWLAEYRKLVAGPEIQHHRDLVEPTRQS